MTVEELIEELKKLPPKLRVVTGADEAVIGDVQSVDEVDIDGGMLAEEDSPETERVAMVWCR